MSTSIGGCKKKKKNHILLSQTLLYLFYQLILQLTLHFSFYFYIQPNKIYKLPNKIIKSIIIFLFPPTIFFSSHTTTRLNIIFFSLQPTNNKVAYI